MILKKRKFLVFSLLGGLFFYLYLVGQDLLLSSNNISLADTATTLKSIDIKIQEQRRNKTYSNISSDNCIDSEQPLLMTQSMRTLSDETLLAQKLLVATSRNPNELVTQVNAGNAGAIVAAFLLLRTCLLEGDDSIDRELFPELDVNTTTKMCNYFHPMERRNPLGILAVSANNGSAEAQLLYSMNVESLITVMKFYGAEVPEPEAAKMMKLAELYGKLAAQGGLEEAYWFMAHAYDKGLFGERNSMKAYAFTIPLSTMRSTEEVRERMEYLDRKLTRAQAMQAQKIAIGCKVKVSNKNVFANPFEGSN